MFLLLLLLLSALPDREPRNLPGRRAYVQNETSGPTPGRQLNAAANANTAESGSLR